MSIKQTEVSAALRASIGAYVNVNEWTGTKSVPTGKKEEKYGCRVARIDKTAYSKLNKKA